MVSNDIKIIMCNEFNKISIKDYISKEIIDSINEMV